jgi:hypothetical protein
MIFSEIVGSVGVGLLLFAFLLNLCGRWSQHSLGYIGLNIIGAGLSCYASILIGFVPFVILEGTWTLVACVALVRKLRG